MRMKMFPFNKVSKDCNIVIYGMGTVGKGFVNQINCLSYCNIVGVIDKDYRKENWDIKQWGVDLFAPNEIQQLDYDYVVVASDEFKLEIERSLLEELSVPKKKIILLDENYYSHEYITPNRNWTSYYNYAEKEAKHQFQTIIGPIMKRYSLVDSYMSVMDFACGWGRIAEFLKDQYAKLVLCDISEEALNYCRERFVNCENIEYIKSETSGLSLNSESLDFIYSWDAMVHFSYKLMDIYIGEFGRVLKEGGYCMIHHSNLENSDIDSRYLSENFNENIHWRGKMTIDDISRIAKNHKLKVVEQIIINWGGIKKLDGITILKK